MIISVEATVYLIKINDHSLFFKIEHAKHRLEDVG